MRQADGDGTIESICRDRNISRATFHRWRRKYSDIEKEDLLLEVFVGSGTTGAVLNSSYVTVSPVSPNGRSSTFFRGRDFFAILIAPLI